MKSLEIAASKRYTVTIGSKVGAEGEYTVEYD